MTDAVTLMLGPEEDPWNVSADDPKRQAIASLRGYVYQLHQSLAAWIALPNDATLHLEIAEDYATVARDPTTLEAVLEATQIKETRESGSVTLNSADVLATIRNFWALRAANPGRAVRLVFLTTSPVGRERNAPFANGKKGLELWTQVARGGPVSELRAALSRRFELLATRNEQDLLPDDYGLAAFLEESDDETLRRELIQPVRWACGAPDIAGVEADNREALVVLGHSLGGTPDLSARAADLLLMHVLSTIIESSDRRLRRGDLLEALHNAVTVRVPAQHALGLSVSLTQGLDLEATGAWRRVSLTMPKTAPRPNAVSGLRAAMSGSGSVWVHGATGLGKSLLAELAANAIGGSWRLLDLRAASGAIARERLIAARNAVLADPSLAGVIIDDILPSLERDIESPLSELARSLERRSIPLIATSNHLPGRRLARAVGLSEHGTHPAPLFDRDDAAALVEAYGGDPVRWTVFALYAGVAHPQLVDVVVAGLERRGWPDAAMREWMSAGMRNEDVEAEREAVRRRLLGELTPDTLAILARTTHIYGTFDRALVQAIGGIAPSVASPGLSLDQLSGQWIERLTATRMRTSPLVGGLDRETLEQAQLTQLDLAIVEHILQRQKVESDFLDAAFFHAWSAQSEPWINWMVQYVIQAGDEDRPKLASALPLMRGVEGTPPFLAGRTEAMLLLQLARHLLRTAIGDGAEVAKSAATLTAHLENYSGGTPEAGNSIIAIVLMKTLFDVYGHGRVPNWFALLRRFDAIARENADFRAIVAQAALSAHGDTTAFLFVAHAARLPGLAALERLFNELEDLPAGERAVWIGAMHGLEPAMSMIVDNSWLKEAQRGAIDGTTQAAIFNRLGALALGWGEPRLAGRCWRAQAVMLDEYAKDRDAAYGVLDEAEARLPNSFDIARERAKMAWRANDYESALEQLLALEHRMGDTEPYDAAFALREAATSASELGRWSEAARLFAHARDLAVGDDRDPLAPVAVGLTADAAFALFRSGDRIEAVRQMAIVLDALADVDPDANLAARSVHLLVRHLLLWTLSENIPIEFDGEPVHFAIGGASNPDPKKTMATLPVTPLAPVWKTLATIALHVGLETSEILSWPGLIAARKDPLMDAMFRHELLSHAIRNSDLRLFQSALVPAMEAFRFFARMEASGVPADPLQVTTGVIDRLSPAELAADAARDVARQATIAFALVACVKEPPAISQIDALHSAIESVIGVDAVPEWVAPHAIDDSSSSSIVASAVFRLRHGSSLTPQQTYMTQLRMLEWVRQSKYVSEAAPALEALVRKTWTQIAHHQRALLLTPALTIPAIERALSSDRTGMVFIAELLLLAEQAVSVNLSNDFRRSLSAIIGR